MYTVIKTKADAVKAMKNYGDVVDKFQSITRGSAYEPVTDINVRPQFTREDYERYRPGEKLPKKFKDEIIACRTAYKYCDVVRNVIDLMTDFACENFKIIHNDKQAQALLKSWTKKIRLKDHLEEFVRHLLIDHNVVVKRITGKISKPAQKQMLKAEPDLNITKGPKLVEKGEIPWGYNFLNITLLQWQDEEVNKLIEKKSLEFVIPKEMVG